MFRLCSPVLHCMDSTALGLCCVTFPWLQDKSRGVTITEEAAGSSELVLVITSRVWPYFCLKVNLQFLMQKSISFMVEAVNRRAFLQEKARRPIKTTMLTNAVCCALTSNECIPWHSIHSSHRKDHEAIYCPFPYSVSSNRCDSQKYLIEPESISYWDRD